ncbi:MAG TPA: hypothetical protein VMD25_04565 [Acidobacteriaceae bacterium]|nr:hypothetical protein [Acidobacteriaceae bacterium]
MDVTIYDAVNFGGRSATLQVGNYPLTGSGAPLDKVASIQVPAGIVAMVFEMADGAGGYGRSADLMENYADVSTLGLSGIPYIQVFLSERDAPLLEEMIAKAPAAVAATAATSAATKAAATAPTTAIPLPGPVRVPIPTPITQQFWTRGAVVNEQYVAGHWTAGTGPASQPGPAVVSPGPLPHLLHITTIQGQDMTNPAYNTSASNWASQVVGGTKFDGSTSHPLEWVSVLNPTVEQDDEVGVAGFALAAQLSGADLPFTHPFGGDFEFQIVPDAGYANLLAPSNIPPANENTDSEIAEAFGQFRQYGLPEIGSFAMEVDAGIVPEPYRAVNGDRVAVYGRWIIDAGHDDFHSEIHPPLLLARAQVVNAQGTQVYPDAGAMTQVQIWGRPYQTSQKFTDGSSTNLCLQDYLKNIAETTGDIVANPQLFPKPLDGVHLVTFIVRPPVPTPPTGGPLILGPAHLECSYSFTTNKSCGVQVMQSYTDPNAVEVILALNSAAYPTLPAQPSTLVPWTISSLESNIPPDLGALTSFLVGVVTDYQNAVHGGKIYVRTINPLPTPNVSTNVVPFTPLASLPESQVNVDDTQPFPIVGWVKVQWVRTSSIAVESGLHQVASAESAQA